MYKSSFYCNRQWLEVSAQLHASDALPPLSIIHRRLGEPQNRSGRRGKQKFLDPTGTYLSVIFRCKIITWRHSLFPCLQANSDIILHSKAVASSFSCSPPEIKQK
jgi:hypothetical protein